MIENLINELRSLWATRRQEVATQWNRALPFGDYVVDRWAKARSLGFAEGVSIYDSAHVYGDVQIGRQTSVDPFVILDGTGVLRIGSHCSISAGVQIYTHDSVRWAISGGDAAYEYAPILGG